MIEAPIALAVPDDQVDPAWFARTSRCISGSLVEHRPPGPRRRYAPEHTVELIRVAMADPLLGGVEIAWVQGWEDRGRPWDFEPAGVVCHHTATSRRAPGDYPSLGIVRDGRSDLPGPLSQFGLGRDRAIWVIAGGLANHAGSGGWDGLAGNWSVWGIEAENDGIGEPWTSFQLHVYPRLCAALARATRFAPRRVCGHKEWTSVKIDPHGIDMSAMRAHVGDLLAAAPTPAPEPIPEEEPDVALPYLFWHQRALYLGAPTGRSDHGLQPATCDRLIRAGSVVVGEVDDDSQLMDVLPPLVRLTAATAAVSPVRYSDEDLAVVRAAIASRDGGAGLGTG